MSVWFFWTQDYAFIIDSGAKVFKKLGILFYLLDSKLEKCSKNLKGTFFLTEP